MHFGGPFATATVSAIVLTVQATLWLLKMWSDYWDPRLLDILTWIELICYGFSNTNFGREHDELFIYSEGDPSKLRK